MSITWEVVLLPRRYCSFTERFPELSIQLCPVEGVIFSSGGMVSTSILMFLGALQAHYTGTTSAWCIAHAEGSPCAEGGG